MIFNKSLVATFLLSAGSAAAFAPKLSSAFVATSTVSSAPVAFAPSAHAASCACPACSSRACTAGCACSSCVRSSQTMLFSTTEGDVAEGDVAAEVVAEEVVAEAAVAEADVPAEVEAPARKSPAKKVGARGKPLSEFSIGDSVKATVKSITNYGAFLDIGSTTDGLLHISQLSIEFVSDVNEILKVGQEIDVRITNIDEAKSQVALSLLSAADEATAKEAANRSRAPRSGGGGGSNRRDDGSILKQLIEKGWKTDLFVEGTVVSTVDFGAFVRVDASQLAEGLEGEFDGLVHISALTAGRADSVEKYVSVDQKVQIRVKGIADRKVSLTMVSVEDEAAKNEKMGNTQQSMGAKDWKESLTKMQADVMPEFKNRPMLVETLGSK